MTALVLMSLTLLPLSLLSAPPAHAQGGYPGDGPPPGHYWKVNCSSQNSAESMDYIYGNPNNIMHWGPYSWTDTPGASGAGGGAGGQYSVDAASSGTVKTTLTWVPANGDSASDPPPPSSRPVLILESSYAGWNLSGPPNPPPGGAASDGLGDSPAAPQNGVGQISSGKKIIWKDGSSGTITLDPVTLNANTPPYPGYLQWGYATASAYFNAGIDTNDRAVTISSEIEDSYYKSEDGYSGSPIQLKHIRNEDGSMNVDSAAQWEAASVYSVEGWHVDNLPLTATPVNFLGTPTFSWSLQGLSQGYLTVPTANPTYLSLVEADWHNFPLHGTVQVDATDSDGTIASNTYTVTWHLPMENWQLTGTSAPFWQLNPLEGTPAYTGHNGSVSGDWEFTEDANGKNLGLGDMFAAASGLVDPPWAAFIAFTGIVLSKTQPETPPVHTVVFNNAWTDTFSTFSDGSRPPDWPNSSADTMMLYKMSPKMFLEYETRHYLGEQYNLHGYAGPITESYDKWLAWDFAGDFTLISQSSPPPPP